MLYETPRSAASRWRLLRERRRSPTKSSWSGESFPTQPRANSPSIVTPLDGHQSRVTTSSAPLAGSRVEEAVHARIEP